MQNLNKEKFNCTGCGGCANVCPVNAITIKLDKEGFYQYSIDSKKCINCGLCIKICPKLNKKEVNKINDIECYAAYSKSNEVLKNSSSGGLFYEISKYILENNGLVAGAVYNDNKVKHVLIDNINDLKKLQGSKYIQSYTGNIYKEIKKQIKTKKILFSGTPCQCSAIKQIIKNDNLITIDIVCHGVPSKKVFEKSLEDRFNTKITNVNFRYKNNSWMEYSLQYSSNSKIEKTIKYIEDEWFSGYLKNLYLMKSCYSCEFNKLPRCSDITLADCWGIQNLDKQFFIENKDRGVSLILLNNSKGKEIFKEIKNNVISKKQEINDYKVFNPRIFDGKYSKEMLEARKNFFEKEINISFNKKRYSMKLSEKIIRKVKSIVKKVLGK